MEGTNGFYSCKRADLEKARAEGRTLTWSETAAEIFCHTITSANLAYEATGRVSVLVIEDTTGLQLISKGLAPHSVLVHVRFKSCPESCAKPIYLTRFARATRGLLTFRGGKIFHFVGNFSLKRCGCELVVECHSYAQRTVPSS